MRSLLAYISLLFHFFSLAMSQDSIDVVASSSDSSISQLIIDQIIIIGNHQTKDYVILREMSLKPGSQISLDQLEYEKNRIYSLGLFNQVELSTVPSTPGFVNLIVAVNERWYIFPYPIFGIKDRDWSKLFYGLGILHSNFRGRNEKLSTSLVLGYDPSVSLWYRNGFLDHRGRHFLDTRMSYSKVRNKSLRALQGSTNFDERHVFISVALGRRFGNYNSAWISASYEIVDVTDNPQASTLSPDGIDRFPLFAVGYLHDTRDLAEYPAYGFFARAAVTKFGFLASDIDLVRYALDLRQYIPFTPRVILTGRAFTDLIAGGRTPAYNRVYFGYSNRIRGHFNEVMEGENIIGASSELHVTLLTPRYFNFKFLPSEFEIWRFAISLAAFADAGTVWFRGEPLVLNRFAKGYGLGIHFLLPYSAVLRVEYAWNELRKGQFIIDLGSSF
ncbi:MAG: BamA/TamA family outer membrane protein [Ignavibacteriae bacterium]|nr:BamA/TamA family outer membrane protein [Ignavibacteriota bacterium]